MFTFLADLCSINSIKKNIISLPHFYLFKKFIWGFLTNHALKKILLHHCTTHCSRLRWCWCCFISCENFYNRIKILFSFVFWKNLICSLFHLIQDSDLISRNINAVIEQLSLSPSTHSFFFVLFVMFFILLFLHFSIRDIRRWNKKDFWYHKSMLCR